MNESKHTPGPWEIVSLSGCGSPFSIRMEYHSDNPIAHKTHYGVQSVRRLEDASLIAAAPDVLEGAKALIASLMSFSDAPSHDLEDQRWHFEVLPAMRTLEAAISKAEGR